MTTLAQAIAACDDARTKINVAKGYLTSVSTPTPGDYGAIGDGVADDTTALQTALDAMGTGQALTIPAGKVYRHTAVVKARNAGMIVQGSGTIYATAEATSAFWVDANNVTLRGDSQGPLVFKMGTTTTRWGAPEQHKLVVQGRSGVTLSNIEVNGSAGAGVFTNGASNYTYNDLYVHDTRADAIHNTLGANNGTINRPRVVNSGDDGVAVVSYVGDGVGVICHDITINSPRVMGSGARGCSVVGGNNITYNDIYVGGSSAAGFYVAAEDSFNTYGVNTVTVNKATLDGCNWNSAIDHGAVCLYNGQPSYNVANVSMFDFLIRNVRATASDQVRPIRYTNPAFVNLVFTRFTLVEGTSNLFFTGHVTSAEYTRTTWVYNGVAVAGT